MRAKAMAMNNIITARIKSYVRNVDEGFIVFGSLFIKSEKDNDRYLQRFSFFVVSQELHKNEKKKKKQHKIHFFGGCSTGSCFISMPSSS